MSDLDKIRNEILTEDAKMEIIADHIKNNGDGVVVVTIDALTGTLSDEEYEKVSNNNCVIVVGTQYFYKQYSASTVIRYGAIPRLGTNKVIFDYIDIDKGTKAYEVKNESFPSE